MSSYKRKDRSIDEEDFREFRVYGLGLIIILP